MVNPELKAFIEAEIIPEYKNFGRSHNVEHVRRVISNSLELAKFLGDGKRLRTNRRRGRQGS